MLWLTPPTGDPSVHAVIRAGRFAYIDSPAQGNRRDLHFPGVTWCADNSVFGAGGFKGYDWWWRWLERNAGDAGTCLFATAPDALCDHQRSYRRSDPWLDRIRGLGYPAAWVAQNGATLRPGSVPWDRFDCLFLGGDDPWKDGPTARALVAEAKARGKWVHCGRVNGDRRYQVMRHLGVDSADGTYLTFGPSKNLPLALRWGSQGDLFLGTPA